MNILKGTCGQLEVDIILDECWLENGYRTCMKGESESEQPVISSNPTPNFEGDSDTINEHQPTDLLVTIDNHIGGLVTLLHQLMNG